MDLPVIRKRMPKLNTTVVNVNSRRPISPMTTKSKTKPPIKGVGLSLYSTNNLSEDCNTVIPSEIKDSPLKKTVQQKSNKYIKTILKSGNKSPKNVKKKNYKVSFKDEKAGEPLSEIIEVECYKDYNFERKDEDETGTCCCLIV